MDETQVTEIIRLAEFNLKRRAATLGVPGFGQYDNRVTRCQAFGTPRRKPHTAEANDMQKRYLQEALMPVGERNFREWCYRIPNVRVAHFDS